MKKFLFLVSLSIILIPLMAEAKDLTKVAVWDLTSGDIKKEYAQDLTLILVSEISKLGTYEVYSQENVRTLAGWTEERMKLGCTSTQCLTALGQMEIAKLVSGRIGKIGDRFSLSLNLFDTQNAKSERSISEFCRSENELIELVQGSVRKLLGVESSPSLAEQKAAGGELKTTSIFSKIPLENGLIMGDGRAPLKIAVFTDPDCPYCQKFHEEMKKVIEERRDIAFSIFLFPLKSHKDAYWKSKSIVCHKSLKMLEDAFAHKEIPKPECDTKEIDDNINLGNSIGIRGTPTVIFPDGRMQVGAVAAKELFELLREKR